jgi:hypothetical protein
MTPLVIFLAIAAFLLLLSIGAFLLIAYTFITIVLNAPDRLDYYFEPEEENHLNERKTAGK